MEQKKISDEVEEMEVPVNIDTIEEIEPKTVDLNQFHQEKVRIEGIEVREIETRYGHDGKPLEPGKTRKTKVLKVFSIPVISVQGKDGEFQIRASELFNMKFRDGVWGIPADDRSSIQKFMKVQKVKKVKDLVNTLALMKAYQKNGKTYLGFIY
jgi:hypothetical protein